LNPRGAAAMGERRSQIGFNYLGRFENTGDPAWTGLGQGDPGMPLGHVVDINAVTMDGAEGPQLNVSWTWAPALLPEAAVRELAEGWFAALKALVKCAAEPGAGGLTPSDVPLVALTQDQIEQLEAKLVNRKKYAS
jgi:non-ribosomal peptide synthase protein (TIGR01720 family)